MWQEPEDPLYFSRTVCGRTDTGCGCSQEADLCTDKEEPVLFEGERIMRLPER